MNEITVINSNSVVNTQNVNMDLIEAFINYIDAAPKTVTTYSKALKQLFNYFSFNGISQPTREDIIAFKEELKATGHKPTTVQNYIAAAKVFFRWTAQEGYYPNIAEHIKGAKLNREHKKDYLTSRQVKDILSNIEVDTLQGLRDYAILLLMVTGGLRTIEVIRANVEDLRTVGDFTVLYVQGKGREEKAEYIKINFQTEKAIRAYLVMRGKVNGNEPLFTSLSNKNKGERLTTRTIRGLVKDRLKNAGYDSDRLTAHSLRHTAVTLSLLAGKPLEEVQQFARHANLATTMIYNHSLDKAKNGCSEAIENAIFN